MGEKVLCGIVRTSSDLEDCNEQLAAIHGTLSRKFPFIYLSGPSEQVPEKQFDTHVIKEEEPDTGTTLSGIRSILKVLRQPVVVVSAERKPPEPSTLDRLTDRWDQCPDRLSGVFLRTSGEGVSPYPGLYATPLLPALRTATHNSNTLEDILESEPIRTIQPDGNLNRETEIIAN
ncbi:MAG: hypothetical protein ABEK50_08835 [bacterium]